VKITTIGKNKSSPDYQLLFPGSEGTRAGQTFSSTLDTAEREQTHKQLMEMVDKIKTAGNRLKSATTEANIREYKNLVKSYLSYVLKNCYQLKHDRSINYSTVYTRVEVINRELDELTKKLLEQEKNNLDIVAEVDRITGLIIDVYS